MLMFTCMRGVCLKCVHVYVNVIVNKHAEALVLLRLYLISVATEEPLGVGL